MACAFTCDATLLNPESYRLSTEAQALNFTRPRTQCYGVPGCFDGLQAEARVPWIDVREIAAGNFVL